jgi:hypothetical protein
LTNAVGSALFACDIEKCGGLVCLRTQNDRWWYNLATATQCIICFLENNRI